MHMIKPVITPKFLEAIFITIAIFLLISISIIQFGSVPHIPILLSILLLFGYGLVKGVSYQKLEKGLVEGAGAGMSAVFLFFFIGMLISSWMISGTIPTMIYAGFSIISMTFFFAIVFIVTSLIGLSVGSSLTTVATIGVAFIGMATAMDLSLAVTAGAIVSGAFFGDKMSPLSDTTNLSSSIVGVDLFEHIRNMGWTTIPAFVLTLIFFLIVSPRSTKGTIQDVSGFKEGLLATGMIHWYTLIPLIVLIVLTFIKVPALMTLAISSISAIVISFLHQVSTASEIFNVLFSGYVSSTGIAEIDSLLSRGGMESMMFTVALVLLALSMGGLLFTLGIVQCLLAKIESLLKKVSSVIAASALTAIGINILIGEQYLSILLTGQAFKEPYDKVGLAGKNLSRVMEDAGTVVNPLVPWSVCGIFITGVIGVPTLEYLPFAVFCLLSPVLTVLFGFTGKTLTYK
ncbi:Na+/H+ antiporter NhaC [Planococcus halocryophilus]|uniref:Na+/H+ antiporter NhaC n=1 Tax=Planococcus halocryophilus TaxID=1215089 RepID=UPI001F1037CD|nr:Na+/H+ antiporter NhaC [Planococcus halocryophilus]MCH4826994.1 Na+/H+ antiporter NhaC [Planococcus halocryophilus]